MTPGERKAWEQALDVVDALLDLPAERRTQCMVELGLAANVRMHVQSLLAAHAGRDGVLDHPCMDALAPVRDALAGRRLGRWLLEHEIGRGGMAVVYRAHSVEGPAGQDAALKILTLGTLAESGRERFLREQDALLRLSHPYIAALYDAGVAADGTPWLAMARVEGERVDAWCDACKLDVPARVRLMLQVCEAVAHAHRSLVIHRDIKPGNVLVDGDGHVRLLDFGIARLADAGDEPRTRTALRALTPEYAAPEQFEGAPAATTMDVYGIGALLYRLLGGVSSRTATGTTRATGAIAAPPPSRALRLRADLGEDDRRHRAQALRGDLDAIVMKALAPEPDARYASVDALGDDLRRWLDGRPVRAQPPSLRYRFGKFVARHRLGAAVAALLLLAVSGGIVTTLWQAGRAQRAAERSQAQLGYLRSVLEVLAPATEANRELERGEVIAEAAKRAQQELAARPGLLANVRISLGDVARSVGDYRQAKRLYAAAWHARQREFGSDSGEAGEALARLGAMTAVADPPDPLLAERQLAQAVTLLRRHRPGSAELVDALVERANSQGNLDRYDDTRASLAAAAALCARSLRGTGSCDAMWATQGTLALRQGHLDEAIAALQRLLAERRRVHGEGHARTAFAYGLLGDAYLRKRDHVRAVAMLERAHALQQRIYPDPTGETLRVQNSLIDALFETGQRQRAFELRRDYIAKATRVFGADGDEVALGYTQLGSHYYADGRYDDAAQAYRQGYETYRKRLGADSAGAAIALGNWADALRALGRLDQALDLQRQSLALSRKLFGERSPRTASRLSNLGLLRRVRGEHAQALALYDQALDVYREAQRAFSVAVVRAYRSQALLGLGRDAEAGSEARAALQQIEAEAGRGQRYWWEGLALLLTTACGNGAADCADLQRQAQAQLAHDQMPGRPRKMLQDALAAARRWGKGNSEQCRHPCESGGGSDFRLLKAKPLDSRLRGNDGTFRPWARKARTIRF